MNDSSTLPQEKNSEPATNSTDAPEPEARVSAVEASAGITITYAKKDQWDKLAAVAPMVSGLLIFVAGGVFTYTYNQQQLKVQEIQTIEKFIPHLTGNEQNKKAAILAINSLTDAKLAGKIAAIYASSGTVSALQSLTKTGTDNERAIAEQALAKTMDNLRQRQSRLDSMENEYKQAIQDNDSSTAADADTPVNLIGMAVTYKTIGQYQLAEQLLKRALMLVEKKHGAESLEAADIWRKLADLNVARGNRAQSEACLKRAKSIEAKTSTAPAPAQEATPAESSSEAPASENPADASPKG